MKILFRNGELNLLWPGSGCPLQAAAEGRAEALACSGRGAAICVRVFQQCKSFVEMCTVRCCPRWHPAYCPMGTVPLCWCSTLSQGTVPRVLVRRTASPAHADFGGLSSGAAPVVVRLDVVPLPPRSSSPTVAGCRLGGYPVRRDRWGGKSAAGGMYPALTLAPTCGANRAS